MSDSIVKHIISFFFFSLIQVLLFLNFNIYEYGFAFVFIGFILFLPLNTPTYLLLILAFVQGAFIDLFYNSMGINAFSLVLLAYLKPTFSKMFIPRMIDDITELKSIEQLGIQRTILVILIMTFIHHFVIFNITNGFDYFFSNLVKTILSTLITTTILLIFKNLFFKNL